MSQRLCDNLATATLVIVFLGIFAITGFLGYIVWSYSKTAFTFYISAFIALFTITADKIADIIAGFFWQAVVQITQYAHLNISTLTQNVRALLCIARVSTLM